MDNFKNKPSNFQVMFSPDRTTIFDDLDTDTVINARNSLISTNNEIDKAAEKISDLMIEELREQINVD